MMQTSHLRELNNISHLGRMNSPRLWGVFGQSQMSPAAMVIRKIAFQDPSQMSFSQHDHVIQAVTSNRSDQPLHEGTLPGTCRSGEDFLDAHASEPFAKVTPIDLIPIPEHVTRCRILGKRLHHLLSCPAGRRTFRHVELDYPPAVMSQHDQYK